MESFEIKKKFGSPKAIFFPTEIVIQRKKESIIIPIDCIEKIIYCKPTVTNYLPILNLGSTPKLMRIELNTEINKRTRYALVVGYKEVIEIQKFFQKEILIVNAM